MFSHTAETFKVCTSVLPGKHKKSNFTFSLFSLIMDSILLDYKFSAACYGKILKISASCLNKTKESSRE